MNKDVIYIDVEDDITAIIDKVKEAKEKVVALVPPRHSGVLQSAVNLRLLSRMAEGAKKNVVLVTNNQALIALAAAAKIPVAKNLQSKPELAEVPALAVDNDDDIIDGSQIPVGQLVGDDDEIVVPPKQPVTPPAQKASDDSESLQDIDIDGEKVAPAAFGGVGAAAASRVASKKPSAAERKPKNRIPNFGKFRRNLFLSGIGAILLIALLVWMYAIAPAATIVIATKTTASPISTSVSLLPNGQTSFANQSLAVVTQTLQKNETTTFTPTGTKQSGTKASGQVTFQNVSSHSIGLAAGTTLTSPDNYTFTLDSAVTVPAASVNFNGGGPGTASGSITATDVGSNYNENSGTVFTVSGQSSTSFRAVASSAISGGDSHTVPTVSQQDVTTAEQKLQSGDTVDSAKKTLQGKFDSNDVILTSSFTVAQTNPSSNPAVNADIPDGTTTATLTVPTTYTMTAVPLSALKAYLKDALNSQIDNTAKQQIIDDGSSKASFSGFQAASDSAPAVAVLNATGQIGPKIDTNNVKSQAAGEKAGQVQADVTSIDPAGITDVQVKFSHWWVHKVPKNTQKITVEFKVSDGK